MDILSFIAQMKRDGTFGAIAGNAAAQFGPAAAPYLGATILPERLTQQNMFKESGIRYSTVIANDGSRYSPVQKKDGGELVGSFSVELGDQNIGREFDARDHDAVLELLAGAGGNLGMQAAADLLLQWTDTALNRALIEKTEKQRWEALVNASVIRVGDQGYTETVPYPNPPGHRAAVAGTWGLDTYDPFDDMAAMIDLLADKGYAVNRIVTSTRVQRILQRNDKMARHFAPVRVLSASDVLNRLNLADLNGGLQANGLPAIETYDRTYRDQAGRQRFLADNVMVFLSTTGRDQTVEVADGVRYLPDTVGYTAIGRAPGQPLAGRVINVDYDDDPPHLEGKARQTSLPVVTEPESVAVLTSIG